MASRRSNSAGFVGAIGLVAVVLIGCWWALAESGARDVPGLAEAGANPVDRQQRGAAESVPAFGPASESSAVAQVRSGHGGLLFRVVDHEDRGQAGWSITMDGSEGALGVTDTAGRCRVARPDRMVEDATFQARRGGGASVIACHRVGEQSYCGVVVPGDAVAVLVVRSDTGAPIEDAAVSLQVVAEMPSHSIGTSSDATATVRASPGEIARITEFDAHEFPWSDENEPQRNWTNADGRAVFQSIPPDSGIWVLANAVGFHADGSGEYQRPGGVVRIELDPVLHALIVGEGGQIARVRLGDRDTYWQNWRPTCAGQDGVGESNWREHPKSIPIVAEDPKERWIDWASGPEPLAKVRIAWRDRRGFEEHEIRLRPVVDGPHVVRLRPTASPEPRANAELRIRVVDLSGVAMDSVALQVWGSTTSFIDKGVVSSSMIVPAGFYRVAPADARLRRWAKPLTVRADGGETHEVEVKFERPMVCVRPNLVAGGEDYFQIKVTDSRGQRLFADGAIFEGEDSVHWVPADLLTVTLIRSRFMQILTAEPGSPRPPATRETWRQTFDLRTVRRDRIVDLTMDVSVPPDSKK